MTKHRSPDVLAVFPTSLNHPSVGTNALSAAVVGKLPFANVTVV